MTLSNLSLGEFYGDEDMHGSPLRFKTLTY